MNPTKSIAIKAISLENFKGYKEAKFEFDGNSAIEGANGSGKSSIFDGYLWCLFEKNQLGNAMNVQPYDANNQLVHNLVTSVSVELIVNGMPVKITRKQSEKWVKPSGKTELVFKGTTQERYVNDVPMSVAEFKAKLADLCPLDEWFMLSSISIIPGMNQEERRALLTRIAPKVDENTILAKYPEILSARNRNLNINELLSMTKSRKAKAKDDLELIPARIDQQEKLRVNLDFNDIEQRIANANIIIENIDNQIAEITNGMACQEDTDAIRNIEARIAELKNKVLEAREGKRANIKDACAFAWGEYKRLLDDYNNAVEELNQTNRQASAVNQGINDGISKLNEMRSEWQAENDKQFEYPDYVEIEVAGVCPTCGQPIPEDQINRALKAHYQEYLEAKQRALHDFTETKVKNTNALVEKANKVKAEIATLKADCAHLQEKENILSTAIAAKKQNVEEASKKYDQASKPIEDDEKTQRDLRAIETLEAELANKRSDIEAKLKEPTEAIVALKRSRAAVACEMSDLQAELSHKATNSRIDELKAELEIQKRDLAQAVADCENIEAQIAGYKKDYISAVEKGVSSFFSMVRWKLYEPNISNDGEKEICQAVIDGIPYEQQNKATQFNAAIDIINGIAGAIGYSLPIFIDNKESVSNLIETNGQVITLSVVPGAELNIKTL